AVRDGGTAALPPAHALGTAYDRVWPSFAVDGPTAEWSGAAPQVRAGAGTLVRSGPLPGAEPAAIAADEGRDGLVVDATTSPLPAGPYGFGLQVRSERATDDVVALVTFEGPGGEVLFEQAVTGREADPALGYRPILGSFHTAAAGPVRVTVSSTGAAPLRVGGVQLRFQVGGSLVGTSGFPGLGLSALWIAGMLGVGVLLARGPRARGAARAGTSGTTARG
ncbi:MAG TPA: hypothetical protein VIL49_14890, partial [Capillimicrobium sp.]